MREFKESIQKRSTGSSARSTQTSHAGSGESFQTPIITVIATVEEDIDFNEAQVTEGTLNNQMRSAPIVSKVQADHTVNSFGAETVTALTIEDIELVRNELDKHLKDNGFTVEGFSVQAEVTTSSF